MSPVFLVQKVSGCSSPFCHTGSSQAPAAITKRVKLELLQKQHKAGVFMHEQHQLILQLLCTPQAQGSLYSGSSRSTALYLIRSQKQFLPSGRTACCSPILLGYRAVQEACKLLEALQHFQELLIETLTQLC